MQKTKRRAKSKKMSDRRIRWSDLVSPRAVYAFTLQDAGAALPTLLAMAGFFILCLLVLLIFRKIFSYIFFDRFMPQKYVLVRCEKCREGTRAVWKKSSHSSLSSVGHLFIETVFFVGVIVASLFSASIGNVNIWDSPIALTIIGTIVAYIFGGGLQQVGSAYFVYAAVYMVVGEWWEETGTHEGGTVHRITPFFVEFARFDEEQQGAIFSRVPMSTILNGKFQRNMVKEATAIPVVIDNLSKKGKYDIVIRDNKQHDV